MSKKITNWSSTSKNKTNFYGNSAFANAVKLNDTTIKLSSLITTLLGYPAGTHYYDTKKSTAFSTTNKNKTNWSSI